MGRRRRAARIEETVDEVDRLRGEVERWSDTRQAVDVAGRHRTQLLVLRQILCEMVARLRSRSEAVVPDDWSGEVYDACRAIDRRVAIVRRLFDWYRLRFDQRLDPDLQTTLVAADEVVWSCYAEPFGRAGHALRSAPLPYVEARFTANAILRKVPPAELVIRDDQLLADLLAELPIPVIGLPPICVARPWWLVLVAHEVGHHVQVDLDGGSLDRAFPAALAELVTSRPVGDLGPELDDWRGWQREIFADLLSVLLVGDAARWSVEELMLAKPERMLVTDSAAYPPSLLRTGLMATVRDDIGAALLGAQDDTPDLPSRLTELAARVARPLTLRAFGVLPELRQLAGWRPSHFAPGGDADRWRDRLLAGGALPDGGFRETARLCAAGAVAAWIHLAQSEMAPADRAERLAQLAKRILAALSACAEPGDRAGTSDESETVRVATALADRLLTADLDGWVL